ncbi:hypothetical protein AB0P15_14385 [Streptomyces sp. NPDC087917]|uniref:hypothetical protein n=1 Tax=Streptomyces sp. NPDC087917 TaxID=3155060 RepID=UPI00342CDC03
MNTARRATVGTAVRTAVGTAVGTAAVTACAAGLLALSVAPALADGAPAASGTQRTLVKSLFLADGHSTAKVYRLAKDAYQAEIQRAGVTVATLTSRDGRTGVGGAGVLHAALRPDGQLSSWVDETVPEGDSHAVAGRGHKTGVRAGGTGQIVPVAAQSPTGRPDPAANPGTSTGAGSSTGARGTAGTGTVQALRLNTLADRPGGGVLLLAAGGGIAAVGAAGLGFAMLRRGRTDA